MQEEKKKLIMNKKLEELTNYDLATVGFPDSVGSFLIAKLEDKFGFQWDKIKHEYTLQDVIHLLRP